MAEIISFISNSLTTTLLVGYLFALWAALLIWTWLDINARSDNNLFKLGAIIIVGTGAVLGLAIYLLLRPGHTKDEIQVRQIEEGLITSQSQLQACPNCYYSIRRDFTYCPNCSEKLTAACPSCSKKINMLWGTCPYCGKKQKVIEKETSIVEAAGVDLKRVGLLLFGKIKGVVETLNDGLRPKKLASLASETKRKRSSRTSKRKKS